MACSARLRRWQAGPAAAPLLGRGPWQSSVIHSRADAVIENVVDGARDLGRLMGIELAHGETLQHFCRWREAL